MQVRPWQLRTQRHLAALFEPCPMLSRDTTVGSGSGAEALSEKFIKITRRVWAPWLCWSLNNTRFSGSAVAGHELPVAAVVSHHPAAVPPGAGRGSGQRGRPSPALGIPGRERGREGRENGITSWKATLPGVPQEGSYKSRTATGFSRELGTLRGLLWPQRCRGTGGSGHAVTPGQSIPFRNTLFPSEVSSEFSAKSPSSRHCA